MFILKACQYWYQKLKEELHNGLIQGQNGYPNTIKQAYTMIRERRNHGIPRIDAESQLAFMTNEELGEGGDNKVVLPLGGGKAKPYIKCNKCGKQGHYANKCPTLEMDKAISAFGVECNKDKGYAKHKRVSRHWLLLNNQSTTNIMCN
eukprot:1768872-Ditylum_brightwellii.AAC.1